MIMSINASAYRRYHCLVSIICGVNKCYNTLVVATTPHVVYDGGETRRCEIGYRQDVEHRDTGHYDTVVAMMLVIVAGFAVVIRIVTRVVRKNAE